MRTTFLGDFKFEFNQTLLVIAVSGTAAASLNIVQWTVFLVFVISQKSTAVNNTIILVFNILKRHFFYSEHGNFWFSWSLKMYSFFRFQ